MGRRSVQGCLVLVGVMTVLILAATSAHRSLWVTPPNGDDTTEVGEASSGAESGPTSQGDEPVNGRSWGDPIVVAVLVVGAAFVLWVRPTAPRYEPTERLLRFGRWSRRTPLPLVAETETGLTVDAHAARAALAHGSARNAIVACWMQVERDAAAAGLPRDPSETSAEYSERVVAQFSVDPGPVQELAVLYREARFSQHDLDESRRDRAAAALEQVVGSLSRSSRVET